MEAEDIDPVFPVYKNGQKFPANSQKCGINVK